MTVWQMLVGAIVLSLLTVLVAPFMWSSYATPGEFLKKIVGAKKAKGDEVQK